MSKKKRILYYLVNFILATFIYSILLLDLLIFGGGFGTSRQDQVEAIRIMAVFFPMIAIGYFFMIKIAGENRRALLKIIGVAYLISPFLVPLTAWIHINILGFIGLIG